MLGVRRVRTLRTLGCCKEHKSGAKGQQDHRPFRSPPFISVSQGAFVVGGRSRECTDSVCCLIELRVWFHRNSVQIQCIRAKILSSHPLYATEKRPDRIKYGLFTQLTENAFVQIWFHVKHFDFLIIEFKRQRVIWIWADRSHSWIHLQFPPAAYFKGSIVNTRSPWTANIQFAIKSSW